jgi:hypothetical protein
VWGIAAAVALLWPARLSGPLDGMPLDGVVEAILVGVVFPTLLWFHPRFLRTTGVRGAILTILAWKAVAVLTLVPDGWCVKFVPGRPIVSDAPTQTPHSWDVRADWLASRPQCSAIMRRPYHGLGEFPAWFFNLPGATGGYPVEGDRPPAARTAMTVTGFLAARQPGRLQFEFGTDMRDTTNVVIDGQPARGEIALDAGVHRVTVESLLVGDVWRFVPRWNGRDLWRSSATATLQQPSRLDGLVRPAGSWFVTVLVLGWLAAWLVSFLRQVRNFDVLLWSLIASGALAMLSIDGYEDAARWGIVALAGAILLPVPARLRNLTGAFMLVGIPWLTLIVASSVGQIGRFWLYTVGDDYWGFQRNAYRIVLQGYWLEGGSQTFYFQALYRWIAGIIHLVFGDSSVGERYWDGACLLASALFAWRVADTVVGFRAGLVAAVLSLSVLTLGLPWDLIGRGLGENSSAGFLYLAAFVALRSRRGPLLLSIAAGVLATLAFYTRLNNLPMAFGVGLFALSLRTPLRRVLSSWPWRLRLSWRTLLAIPALLAVGLALFAWRTWHYTGVFSVLHGTSGKLLAIWQPGMSAGTALLRGLSSAMMVLTVNDPPRFDWRALPVLAGALAAVLALVGMPRLRNLPAAPTLFFLAGISAAFVARGSAYAGRFSVHIVGITCALAVCAVSALARRVSGHERMKGLASGGQLATR